MEAKKQARYSVVTKGGTKIHALVQVSTSAAHNSQPLTVCYIQYVLSTCILCSCELSLMYIATGSRDVRHVRHSNMKVILSYQIVLCVRQLVSVRHL